MKDLSVMELTCLALARLYDDPTQNNIDCPWNWKEQQMAKIKSEGPHDKLAGLLDSFDREGFGYHLTILKASRIFKSCNVHPEKACEMMTKASEKVDRRDLQPGEIEKAVNHIYQSEDDDLPRIGVKPNKGARKELINEFGVHGDIDDLRSRSQEIPELSGAILLDLFGPDTLLHLSEEVFNGRDVKTVDEWIDGGLERVQYLTPNPLKGTDRGRCLDNILSRNYIVFESDLDNVAGNWDVQAGLIDRLAKDLPLVMVVWSGNKSLHAWFRAEGKPEVKVHKFLNLSLMLGADKSALRPSQLVRFPWGTRTDTGKTQKVIYYG